MRIEVIRPHSDADWETLQDEWRILESHADSSFFQSWTWVGCRVRERFTDPFLVRATEAGRVVGLALFNRPGHPLAQLLPTMRLHETGRPADDNVFIEHNGPLLARGCSHLMQPMLAAALRLGSLSLSGVGADVRDAAAAVGRCIVTATRPAPYARLTEGGEASWLVGLGASTRYQLRRSRRRYEAIGRLVLDRAADVSEGLGFLTDLAVLHQATWEARGHRGAFAVPEFVTFHQALVARGLPRGEVELLRVSTVSAERHAVIGYLYNFRWRDRVYSYQGGFDYAAAGPHQAPGLTCHHLAIEAAIANGSTIYDFLAGAARYKRSLGSDETSLHWLEVTGRYTLNDAVSLVRLLSRSRGVRWLIDRMRIRRAMPTRERLRHGTGETADAAIVTAEHDQAPGRNTAVRLAWPLAAAVIGILSGTAWIGVTYLVGRIL
jgi:CelD/BcsL family acetyltransferase involved in cellulose biosynthesis